jgi:hypothetical protein
MISNEAGTSMQDLHSPLLPSLPDVFSREQGFSPAEVRDGKFGELSEPEILFFPAPAAMDREEKEEVASDIQNSSRGLTDPRNLAPKEASERGSQLPGPAQVGDTLPASEWPASVSAHPASSIVDSVSAAETQYVDSLDSKSSDALDEGQLTRLGGVLYLINILSWLDLPACWDEAYGLAEHVGGWGIVEVLARGLLRSALDGWAEDAIWSVLAAFDMREPGIPVGASLPLQEAFRLPAQWLRRYGPTAPVWVARVYQERLLLCEENAGYLVVDVPLATRSLDEAVMAEVEAYQVAGVSHITWYASDESSKQVPFLLGHHALDGISQSANWWLQRVLGFIECLLLRALGQDVHDVDHLPDLLLFKSGRLLVSRTHLDLYMPMDQVSLPVRCAGLDCDPGWVPDLARIVLFHFD